MTKRKLAVRRQSLASRTASKKENYSPPETRSAKKRRTSLSGIGNVSGCLLTFSPPNQKENARREKEILEKREKARYGDVRPLVSISHFLFYNRDERVRNAKARGQLLVYDINGNDIIGVPPNAIAAAPPLPPSAFLEMMQQQSEKRKQDDDDLIEKVVSLQNNKEVQSLKTEKKDLEDKIGTLTEELNVSKQKQERLSELEKSQAELKNQSESLQKEKISMQKRVDDLDAELAKARAGITEQQSKIQNLQKVADQRTAENEELASAIAAYKKKVGDLESVRIPELEILINTEKDNVARLESTLESLQNELTSRDCKIQELSTELASHHQGNQDELKEKEELKQLCESQTRRIAELEAEVSAHQSSLQVNEQTLSENSSKLKTAEERFVADRKKLNDELESASNLLESLVNEKQNLQLQVRKLERSLEEMSQERDEARSNMQGFDERENELFRKLREGERVRREMHGRIMQLMGNIRVFVRVRPQLPHESEHKKTHFFFSNQYDKSSRTNVGEDLTKSFLELKAPYKDRGGLSDRRKTWRYGFDGVFCPKATQNQVWDAVEPLIQCAVDGSAVTLFAYGQTGSGVSLFYDDGLLAHLTYSF